MEDYANQQAESNWISSKTSLPDEGERVLIIPKETGIVVIGAINESIWYGYFSDGKIHCSVEYWMPLPQPPKK
jgi:hypothetical protein